MTQFANAGVLPRAQTVALAACAGAATVAGFAPLYWFPLPVMTLALLIMLWQRTAGRRDAALVGFAFGLGYFLVGVSWVYVSLHDFGAMPALLAAILTLLFCAILALYPAMTGWLYYALGTRSMLVTLAALPALWTLSEWLRGWVFTGFPWIALGYAQVPSSPLAGYVPILGVYAASFATVASAGLLVTLWAQWHPYQLSTGEHWDEIARRESDRVIAQVDAVAPGFSDTIEHVHVQTPLDLERELGLRRGNVMHVEMGLDSMFLYRPLPELAGYRTPVRGLFLTGASTHPGGGVFGASGRTAAAVMLSGRRRWR